MWYLFIPDLRNIQVTYSGFTDNSFLFRSYVDEMEKLHVKNALNDENCVFQTKDACIEAMDRLLKASGFSDSGIVQLWNQLMSVKNDNDPDRFFVVPEHVFERFTEVDGCVDGNYVYGMIEQLQLVSHPSLMTLLYCYFRKGEPTSTTIVKLISRIFEVWMLVSEEANVPINCRSLSVFNIENVWKYFDMVSHLGLFVKSEIAKLQYHDYFRKAGWSEEVIQNYDGPDFYPRGRVSAPAVNYNLNIIRW